MRYYSTLRPIGPGTCPGNFIEFENFDYRKHIDSINREAWGWVEYAEPLECPEKYDLVAENNESAERGGIVVEYDNELWDVVDIVGKRVLLLDVWTGELKKSIPIATFLDECYSRDIDDARRINKGE
jgi:hypothetical protein